MSKQSEAMKEYFRRERISQAEVGRIMGMGRASVCTMLGGRDNIGRLRAEKLNQHFGFNIDFLLTGNGKLVDETQSSTTLRERILEERLLEKEKEIINLKTQIKLLQHENGNRQS